MSDDNLGERLMYVSAYSFLAIGSAFVIGVCARSLMSGEEKIENQEPIQSHSPQPCLPSQLQNQKMQRSPYLK